MNEYRVSYTREAVKDLKKLDPYVRQIIVRWVRKNLEGCKNPRSHGKGLTADLSGMWRYRVGDYRILADIQDDRILILVLEVGHRREIYK